MRFRHGRDSFDRLTPPLGGGFDNQRASQAKTKENKKKAQELSFVFSYFLLFFRIEVFQGVTAEKNEKFFLPPRLALEVVRRIVSHAWLSLFSSPARQRQFVLIWRNHITSVSGFVNP
jgi:hypothetical protein